MIQIKFKLNDNSISYNSFDDIINLPNYNDIVYIHSNFNHYPTELPNLPQQLKYLNYDNNQLTVLPNLPEKLTELWCSHNQLTVLPNLPQQLIELYCTNNQLTELPSNLPQQLQSLLCHNNQLYKNNIKNKKLYSKNSLIEHIKMITINNLQDNYLDISYNINYRLTTSKFNYNFDYLFH